MITPIDKLPRRHDLDTVVSINPDEAGLFDLYLSQPAPFVGTDHPEAEVLMHLLENGVSSEATIRIVRFETAGSDYRAEVIGMPADSPNWSVWSVLFVVKS